MEKVRAGDVDASRAANQRDVSGVARRSNFIVIDGCIRHIELDCPRPLCSGSGWTVLRVTAAIAGHILGHSADPTHLVCID